MKKGKYKRNKLAFVEWDSTISSSRNTSTHKHKGRLKKEQHQPGRLAYEKVIVYIYKGESHPGRKWKSIHGYKTLI